MTKLSLDQIKDRIADYPEKIQDAMLLAMRYREEARKLETLLDSYAPFDNAESWMEKQERLTKQRKKCDHIHKVIGQWLLDGILEDEYLPE